MFPPRVIRISLIPHAIEQHDIESRIENLIVENPCPEEKRHEESRYKETASHPVGWILEIARAPPQNKES